MTKELLIIFGATGQQGGSVIEQVLQEKELARKYTIRGLSRDPSSVASQALAERGVEVVKCDTASDQDVKAALKGADHVFLMTSSVYTPTGAQEEEVLAKHLADLIVESGATYLIFSSTVSPFKLSGGKYKHVGLFEAKYNAEQYIRTLPIKSSFFIPASFMQNYHTNSSPRSLGDGTYGLINFFSPGTTVPLIDIAADTGKWIVPMLADPDHFAGKGVACATKQYSQTEIADAMSKVSGKTVKHIQIPLEQWESYLPEAMRTSLSEMLQHIGDGYYGKDQEKELEWGARQARGNLTSIEEFLQREPLELD